MHYKHTHLLKECLGGIKVLDVFIDSWLLWKEGSSKITIQQRLTECNLEIWKSNIFS